MDAIDRGVILRREDFKNKGLGRRGIRGRKKGGRYGGGRVLYTKKKRG